MKTQTRYERTIRDADTNLVVHVKPQDIKGAVCRDHQKCVIARAIMRQRKSTARWVDVGNSVVLVGTGKKSGLRFLLNGQAKEQVRFFDENDGRFAPCSVELRAPVRAEKIGAREGTRRGSNKRRSRSRQQPTR